MDTFGGFQMDLINEKLHALKLSGFVAIINYCRYAGLSICCVPVHYLQGFCTGAISWLLNVFP